MGDATRSQPKCLTRLAGRTLLDWQLTALAAANVERVGVVTGYRQELLAPFANEVFHNERWSETNMVGSLLCADPWLRESPVIVSYSDILYASDHVRALVPSDAPIAITYDRNWRELWELRFKDPLSDAESFAVDSSERVVEIGSRIASLSDFAATVGQYMGLLSFNPTGWMEVTKFVQTLAPADRDNLDMTSLLGGLIEAGCPVQGVPIEGRWCEVDSQHDLETYQAKIAAGTTWGHDWRRESASEQRIDR